MDKRTMITRFLVCTAIMCAAEIGIAWIVPTYDLPAWMFYSSIILTAALYVCAVLKCAGRWNSDTKSKIKPMFRDFLRVLLLIGGAPFIGFCLIWLGASITRPYSFSIDLGLILCLLGIILVSGWFAIVRWLINNK